MSYAWIATRLVLGAAFALAAVAGQTALAQQSASYKLNEAVINAGGDPAGGSFLASASYHIKLDAIGDAVAAGGLSSSGFHMDGSFVSTYPPPGEVLGLSFVNKQNVQWNPERSAGAYELYRDTLATLPGTFGSCFTAGLSTNTTSDPTTPTVGQGYFYLATARNRIREEGTKGYRHNGVERVNPAPCP